MNPRRLVLLLAIALFIARVEVVRAQVQYADCDAFANQVTTNLKSATSPQETTAYLSSLTNVATHVTCFAQYVPTLPKRSLISALAQATNQKQTSSPAGSSASTSQVSKPSGSNSIIQDLGGFSATSNGSSFTFQFAPGDLINDLAKAGEIQYCTASLHQTGCIPPRASIIASKTTFSATVNTSTSSSQLSGTTSTAGSPTSAHLKQPANALSFGGISAKYAFLYVQNGTQQSSLITPAGALAIGVATFAQDLRDCNSYNSWAGTVQAEAKAFATGVAPGGLTPADFVSLRYQTLAERMVQDSTCSKSLVDLNGVLTDVYAYQAAIVAQNAAATSKTPLLGLEYDFTAPANKPSYHSAKLNLSWQSAANCSQQVAAATAKARSTLGAPPQPMTQPQGTCSTTEANAKATSKVSTVPPTPQWTISASGGADIYTDEPSASIPSASRLRDVQAGVEITRVFRTSALGKDSSSFHELMTAVGDLSIVGAYYYQDQTSPSILNGPPTSVTFSGLPTTASQVWATRGPINIGQIRFGLGNGKSAHFPLALSYSNRSDLIVHPFFGVQFGVSYDLSGH
jgi:hypothetical protein